MIEVNLSQAQWTLFTRVISEGTFGKSPSDVLKGALKAHYEHIQSGGSPYATGGRKVIDVERPEYGAVRTEARIEAATGKAIPVYQGEVLRMTQTTGGQCVDFNAYNLDDYKEYLDCGMNRMRGVDTGEGTLVWTGSPRGRPMYAILRMPPTCDQYYGGHRCNGLMYESEYGLPDHPNCQDNFAEAIREFGLTPDDVHDSYNFWMKATLDSEGKRVFPWNRGLAKDHVDLIALFDTLAVPVACAGDLASVNSFRPSAIETTVFEKSSATMSFVSKVEEEVGRFENQRTPAEFVLSEVRSTRKLERDSSYRPNFRSLGPTEKVVLELGPDLQPILDTLLAKGIYGSTPEICIIASFCRWYETNRIPNRHVSLRFSDAGPSHGR
jgi:uncharacterized protein YcgI (DUF1989 family)